MSVLPYIPFHRPEMDDAEIAEVIATLRSGWLTTGPRTAQFENDFCAYTGARHALAVSSATAGMHLALAALGVGTGDEVITTPLTFCSTVHVILQAGATPVLADIGRDGNIDPASIRSRITSRTRAILPVHFAGAPCDMDAIWKIAREFRLFVVEDAAHAAGTFYRGSHLGSATSYSDAVVFSFYATKNMTTGEGGMVAANRKELAERMSRLARHGIDKDAWARSDENGSWYYEVLEAGFKYNLTDIQSALGIHQLRKLEYFVAQRARYAKILRHQLRDIQELELPAIAAPGTRHSWHLFVIRLNLDRLKIGRDGFIARLRSKNIEASVHFIPIPLHPFFKKWAHLPENDCPRCLDAYPRLVSLPLYPAMTDDQVLYVAASVREVLAEVRRNRSSFPAAEQRAVQAVKAEAHST